uniref:Leukocyte elastase inhibitor n=1 Tax=Petromyzon marinus TaxID=7757 RepID=A0AAJ7U850_PETMA|nr:leukocyte elastase inhibitor-like [Petromyzon marinus]
MSMMRGVFGGRSLLPPLLLLMPLLFKYQVQAAAASSAAAGESAVAASSSSAAFIAAVTTRSSSAAVSSAAPPPPPSSAMDAVTEANTEFALDLFKALGAAAAGSGEERNVFFSPASVSAALAMLLMGAKEETAAQMSKSLHLDGVEDVHGAYQSLLGAFSSTTQGSVLRMANRLYGEKGYNFLQDFLDSSAKFYQAELAAVNFKGAFEEARKEINAWVEGQTEGKIQDLLASGVVNSLTRLVLVNAVYFKGSWDAKFDPEVTRDAEFKINKNEKKPVKMMYKKAKYNFSHVEELNVNIVELPYEGHKLSMVILVPLAIEDETTGLEKLESALTLKSLRQWTSPENMSKLEVELHLPHFRLEKSYTLNEHLQRLGMASVFTQGEADFSGINGARDLYVSHVAHKAFVEVNEEGTEAAAATAAIVMMRCARMGPVVRADHPFIFFIRENSSGSVLFLGRFASP